MNERISMSNFSNAFRIISTVSKAPREEDFVGLHDFESLSYSCSWQACMIYQKPKRNRYVTHQKNETLVGLSSLENHGIVGIRIEKEKRAIFKYTVFIKIFTLCDMTDNRMIILISFGYLYVLFTSIRLVFNLLKNFP